MHGTPSSASRITLTFLGCVRCCFRTVSSAGLTCRLDVGRVSDWHKTAADAAAPAPISASEDPGVVMTVDLKEYFVAHGFSTQVMAASFRNVDQVAALTACDHLTIGERGRRGSQAIINNQRFTPHLPPPGEVTTVGIKGQMKIAVFFGGRELTRMMDLTMVDIALPGSVQLYCCVSPGYARASFNDGFLTPLSQSLPTSPWLQLQDCWKSWQRFRQETLCLA